MCLGSPRPIFKGQARGAALNAEFFSQTTWEGRGMKTVDRETLKIWLGLSDLFLMDVRTDTAWKHSIAKIEQAHRFDPDKLAKMATDIPKNRKLVLYDENGKTICPSMAQELEKLGFTNLYILEGGFRAWQGKEYPSVPKELKRPSRRYGKNSIE
jgi:rhodanese-related sulfurtransferase